MEAGGMFNPDRMGRDMVMPHCTWERIIKIRIEKVIVIWDCFIVIYFQKLVLSSRKNLVR